MPFRVRHAARRAVLDALATEFRPGLRYSEDEVNGALSKFHPDYACFAVSSSRRSSLTGERRLLAYRWDVPRRLRSYPGRRPCPLGVAPHHLCVARSSTLLLATGTIRVVRSFDDMRPYSERRRVGAGASAESAFWCYRQSSYVSGACEAAWVV